jgi:hypothetical protein
LSFLTPPKRTSLKGCPGEFLDATLRALLDVLVDDVGKLQSTPLFGSPFEGLEEPQGHRFRDVLLDVVRDPKRTSLEGCPFGCRQSNLYPNVC